MILALHYLQGYYSSEISCGQQKLGNYHVHQEFATSVAALLFFIIPKILLYVLRRTYASHMINLKQLKILPENKLVLILVCIIYLSKKEENIINIDTKLHTFTVMGSTCPNFVTLFPKGTCSCGSTTQCCHILAAKMTIGQRDESKTIKINLTQLHKNSRPKSHKKSGRNEL